MGQNLALQIASDPRLQDSVADIAAILGERSQSVPYFNQLVVLDTQTQTPVASYPADSVFQLTQQEQEGLSLTREGVPNQVYTVPPASEGEAAGVAFVAA